MPVPLAGADREHLVHPLERRGIRQGRGSARPAQGVDLVDRADHRDVHVRGEQRLGDEAIARPHPLLPVDDQERDVGVGQLALDPALHALGEDVARPLHAGQVDQDQLGAGRGVGGDAADRPPGRLRARGDDRDAGCRRPR